MGTIENGWRLADILNPSWLRLVGIEKDDDSGGADPDEGDKDRGVGFTEAQRAEIAKILRKERRKYEATIADLRDELEDGKPGGEKGGKPFDQDKDGDNETRQLRRELAEERAAREQDRLIDAAREAAIDAGVDPKRVRRFLRLAELEGIKSSDRERIAEAIAEAVEDNPEFVAKQEPKKDDDSKKDEPKERRPKDSTRDDSTARAASDKADPGFGMDRMRAAYATSDDS